MPIAPGTRLGPYEIAALLGAGGMGEVYRARDTRLNRTVAIKVLPAHVKDRPDVRQRFLREAQAVAALDHPHICGLHDIGQQDDVDFLVMEFLEGETLAQRLEKGALSLDQSLQYGAQIADALNKAHRLGIVHRDLKPGNIMLTRSGVKLLDFGLAKLRSAGGLPAVSATGAPTQSAPLTGEGSILGTLQYMAPEQLEGRDADARTDIFAFGAVIHEMVTGAKAFTGKSQASLIASVLEHEPPPVSTLQPMSPGWLDRVVRRCLAKDPDERWQTAADLGFALTEFQQESSGTPASARAAELRRPKRLPWGIALAALLVAAVSSAIAALLWARFSSPPSQRAPVHLLLSDQRPASTVDGQRSFAVSRDGQRVAFVAQMNGIRRLYLRELQTLQPAVIPGTENAKEPFFSPDGQRIGFFADGRLKVASFAGGTPVALADVLPDDRGATWAPDDTIIFSPGSGAGLWQVPATGGPVRVVAQPDPARKERSYRWPDVLPGGDAVVFTLATSDIQSFDDARLVVRSLRSGEQRELIRGGSFATYAATGHLLFARAGALMAVPFDAARQQVTGAAKPVVDGLVTYPFSGAAQYAVAGNGTLVYIAGRAVSQEATLNWVDRTGKTTILATSPAAYQAPSIAPDGRTAALTIDGANSSIWLLDLERTSMTRLTLEWSSGVPFWTPDGARVAFHSARGGVRRLFWQAADGGTNPEPLTPALLSQASAGSWAGSWAPDGRTLIFDNLAAGSGWDIWVLPAGGKRDPQPFLQTSFNERNPKFSPDGRWVAYESDETGRTEVYVLPFPGPGRKWRISTDGGTLPVWARNGRELFYRNGDATMEVTIQTSQSFSVARPRLLFRNAAQAQYAYDVAPDGRFLMVEDLPLPTLGPLTIVLNWRAELERRLSAAR